MPVPVPAVSAAGNDSLEAPVARRRNDSSSGTGMHAAAAAPSKLGKWKRVVGLVLLAVTILLWTATNFLASTIFADNTYSKPYLVTYINTAFFVLPLVPISVLQARRHPEELQRWKEAITSRFKRPYHPVKQEEADAPSYHDSPVIRPEDATARSLPLPDVLLGGATGHSHELPPRDPIADTSSSAPLTLSETAALSLEFCMLWFLANYFVAACLQYTTVASSTILTSTSSVFTLVFGALFRVERFTVRKCLGVLASLAGIVLISGIDLSGRLNDDEHRGDFPEKSAREIAVGDCLAFLSAVMYGLYAVFLKRRVPDESRIDMLTFFGFVGIINLVLLWPGLILLHITRIEPFKLPPTGRVLIIVLCNSLGSLISDICWAYAVLFTSPIVVTVGLSITIPCSLIGQIILNNQTVGPWYWLGACIVVLSFIFVNHEEKKEEEGPAPFQDNAGVVEP